jgi:hypothetical protein
VLFEKKGFGSSSKRRLRGRSGGTKPRAVEGQRVVCLRINAVLLSCRAAQPCTSRKKCQCGFCALPSVRGEAPRRGVCTANTVSAFSVTYHVPPIQGPRFRVSLGRKIQAMTSADASKYIIPCLILCPSARHIHSACRQPVTRTIPPKSPPALLQIASLICETKQTRRKT